EGGGAGAGADRGGGGGGGPAVADAAAQPRHRVGVGAAGTRQVVGDGAGSLGAGVQAVLVGVEEQVRQLERGLLDVQLELARFAQPAARGGRRAGSRRAVGPYVPRASTRTVVRVNENPWTRHAQAQDTRPGAGLRRWSEELPKRRWKAVRGRRRDAGLDAAERVPEEQRSAAKLRRRALMQQRGEALGGVRRLERDALVLLHQPDGCFRLRG